MDLSLKYLLQRITLVLIFHLIVFQSFSQSTFETLNKRLGNISDNIPLDKVFLHTDRNQYNPDDTIYFQSYISDRFTHKFETSSQSIWVLLIDSKGTTIDSAIFRIHNSVAAGWLHIPKDINPDYYCIKAFTSLMQNFDPSYSFSAWIRVDELITHPVDFRFEFDKIEYNALDTVEVSMHLVDHLDQPLKNEAFNYSLVVNDSLQTTFKSKTTNRGESNLRLYLPDSIDLKSIFLFVKLIDINDEIAIEIPLAISEPLIEFLPEGGNLIPGHIQRIAFNAMRRNGEQLYVSGVIKDNQGRVIDSIRSGRMGPGVFRILPERGKTYHAEFIEFPDRQWIIPYTAISNPTIAVNTVDNRVVVDILGCSAEKVYYLALTMNYEIVGLARIADKVADRINFITDSLPSGTARVILFSDLLTPIAERPLAIVKPKAPFFNLSTNYEFYFPEQETELNIDLMEADRKVSGVFSIAVVDSSLALSPGISSRNLKDELLIDTEIYTRIPDHIRKQCIFNLPYDDIDLLYMTFGWLRYNWDLPEETEKKMLTDFDNYRIEVNRFFPSRQQKRQKEIDYVYVQPMDLGPLIETKKIGESSYIIDISSIDPLTNSIRIIPNLKVKRKIKSVTFNSEYNASYFSSLKRDMDLGIIIRGARMKKSDFEGFNLDSTIIIKGIDVFAKRDPAKTFVNQYDKHYQGVRTKTIDNTVIRSSHSMEDILLKLNPYGINRSKQEVYLRSSSTMKNPLAPPPALFVLDGDPQGTTYESILSMHANNVHSVTVVLGTQGFFLYGEEAIGGVIFIETKLNHFDDEYALQSNEVISVSDVLKKEIEIFRGKATFYNPPKSIREADPSYWIRPTLYWSDEVYIDGSDSVKINYNNHQKRGAIHIIINGVTLNGFPVYGTYRYTIR